MEGVFYYINEWKNVVTDLDEDSITICSTHHINP